MNSPSNTHLRTLSRARQRARASWIFGFSLLAILLAVFFFAPNHIASFKQSIVAVFAALLAGYSAYFFTGDLGINRSWIKASGGMGAFVLMLIFFPKPSPSGDLYRVRITILGPEGEPVEDAEIKASVGAEKKKVEGGWELDIPDSAVPIDRKITIYAQQSASFWHGRRQIDLNKDLQPNLVVNLERYRSVTIKGRVLDNDGNAVAGARVSIVGYAMEGKITDVNGYFMLNAHAAQGQTIRLRTEKSGFEPLDQDHPADQGIATLVLERKR